MKNNCVEDDPEYSTVVEDVDDEIDFIKVYKHYVKNFLPPTSVKLPKNGRFFFVRHPRRY